MPPAEHRPDIGAAFLLTQIGSHAAQRYAERLAVLELRPPHAGILRLISHAPTSQRELADRLGVLPSTLVVLLDELEARDLVARRRSEVDRRRHEIDLTDAGRALMRELAALSMEHEKAITSSLSPDERSTLISLLKRIADDSALASGVHPGYRTLRP